MSSNAHFYLKIHKAQGGTVHEYKDRKIRCEVYFQTLDVKRQRMGSAETPKGQDRKICQSSELVSWDKTKPCFSNFRRKLKDGNLSDTFDLEFPVALFARNVDGRSGFFHREKLPVNAVVISIDALDSGGKTYTTIGQVRLPLWEFGNHNKPRKRRILETTRPESTSIEIDVEFWRQGLYKAPKTVREEVEAHFGKSGWVGSLFFDCGSYHMPIGEVLLHRVTGVAVVYGSGASASDHEFPGEVWITSSRLLFFPEALFKTEANALMAPLPAPLQIYLCGISKISMEAGFECCDMIGCADARKDKGGRLRQFTDDYGYSRLRIWGKLPFFCEIRAPGERVESLLYAEDEAVWACLEKKMVRVVDTDTTACPEKVWKQLDVDQEYVRLGAVELKVGSKASDGVHKASSRWRLSDVNADYGVCSSYPHFIAVPTSVTDEDVTEARLCWEKHRIPVLTWFDQRTRAALLRCAQPSQSFAEGKYNSRRSKLTGYSSSQDAEAVCAHDFYMSAVKKSCGGKLWIADLRPRADAIYNKMFKGGGWESNAEFQNIWPAQMTQEAFEELRPLATARNPGGDIWKKRSESSSRLRWLKQVSHLLEVAKRVQSKLESGISAICHCSSGWDRTSQVCALVQVLVDPHYRTLEGFETLIKKDWISSGHKFAERCQYVPGSSEGVVAPIFVQFLDAVWQIMRQRPTSFEFNEYLLVFLATHCYTDLFGDFLHNSDYERLHSDIYRRNASIWTYVRARRHRFTNSLFAGSCDMGNVSWDVVYNGPVNVRLVRQGQSPSKHAKVSRQLHFKDRVRAKQGIVLDRKGNEWIRVSSRVDDPANVVDAVVRATRKFSDRQPAEEEWVCVRDAEGQLLSNGSFAVDTADVKLWRSLYLRNHFRTRVAHPIARCLLREPGCSRNAALWFF